MDGLEMGGRRIGPCALCGGEVCGYRGRYQVRSRPRASAQASGFRSECARISARLGARRLADEERLRVAKFVGLTRSGRDSTNGGPLLRRLSCGEARIAMVCSTHVVHKVKKLGSTCISHLLEPPSQPKGGPRVFAEETGPSACGAGLLSIHTASERCAAAH